MKKAFTLAEVLITLGIIGVVAAMTIPTLIQNHRKSEASARLKKFYSIMAQAILLSENDNGPAGEWEYFSDVDENDEDIEPSSNREQTYAFFNKYLAKYLKYTDVVKKIDADYNISDNDDSPHILIKLSDSSLLYMKMGACMDLTVDINGRKGKNKAGVDLYNFLLCPSDKPIPKALCGDKTFCPYGFANYNREASKAQCKADPWTCAKLLQIDNWEFKKDYPYKL